MKYEKCHLQCHALHYCNAMRAPSCKACKRVTERGLARARPARAEGKVWGLGEGLAEGFE
jgi:hypothetical protein